MNGDLRRAEDILAELRGARGRAPSAFDEPAPTDLHTRVERILGSVLGVEHVEPSASFGQLGGDSLLGVRVLSRCQRELAVELPLAALGPSTTLPELVAAVKAELATATTDRIPVRQPSTDGTVPASTEQRALLRLHDIDPGAPTYHEPIQLELHGHLDSARLRDACAALLRRHEALRTVFHLRNGSVVATLDGSLDYVELDLGSATSAETARAIHEAALSPMDLTTSAIRYRLLRVGADRSLLVIVAHHTVIDALSMRIVVRDLLSIYHNGDARDLPELPVSALDLVPWAETALTDRIREQRRGYWRRRLAGAPDLLTLPVDRPRSPWRRTGGARIALWVPTRITRLVADLAATEGASLFDAVVTSLALVLRRYATQDDIVLGFPVSGRSRVEAQDVVGYLARLVPLRLTFDEHSTVAEALARTHESVQGARDNADLPLESIVDASGQVRDSAYHPLYQVAVTLVAGVADVPLVPGLRIRRTDLSTGASRFDLRWYMEEVDDGLEGFLEFATDLFSADLAAALVNDFQETLARLSGVRDAVGTPAVAIAEPDAEQMAELVSSLFPAPAGDARCEPAHVLFERHAVERPDQPAVWHDGTELSYRQLDQMADRVAGLLRDTGIHQEELVGVRVERAADRVAAVLGVLKAGGACVLLHPDTDPPVGLVGRTLLDQAGHGVTVVPPPDEPIHRESAGACAVMVDQLACVACEPDGVELTHRGLACSITSAARAFGIDPGTRLLAGAPGDLLTVWQMLVALGSGATLCLPPSGGTEWSSLSTAATASGADVVCAAAPVLTAAEPTSMPGVRLLVTGGERLMRGMRDRWLPHCRMIAVYGCRAGTPVQISARCEAGGSVRPLLGRPLDGVRVYVLDHALRPVPCGAIGEIYVGGPTIGRGYHGRPARTAERYLPDPYAPTPGGRMLRTGDLCLRTVDGRLEFAGRVDHQVTIRGFHVESEEVVTALRALPSVADAAVCVERTPTGRSELVGYLVLDGTAADAGIEARLRKSLHAGLPAGMVPSRLLTVPAIPVTPTGDVDTETLRLLADTGATSVADVLGRIDQMSDEQVHAILRVMGS